MQCVCYVTSEVRKINIAEIITKLIEKNKTISVMESCTGGGLCDEITNVEGASRIFKFGAVTYSNDYKIKLGVSSAKISKFSVYSAEVASEMSRAISEFSNSDYGIGITGKLNCADIENPQGKNNVVYISLYEKDNKKFYNSYIEVNFLERKKNKTVVINQVAYLMKNNIL